MNPRSLTNEITVIKEQDFEIESKTLLMYIRKRIEKVRDCCKMPISFSFSLLGCLSIII